MAIWLFFDKTRTLYPVMYRWIWMGLLGWFTWYCGALAFFVPYAGYSKETGVFLGGFLQQLLPEKGYIQTMGLLQKKGAMGIINLQNTRFRSHLFNLSFNGSTFKKTVPQLSRYSAVTYSDIDYNQVKTSLSILTPLPAQWQLATGLSFLYYREKNMSQRYYSDLALPGLILGLKQDTRDRPFNSTNGHLIKGELHAYSAAQSLTLDTRYFYSQGRTTHAWRFYSAQTNTNKVHFLFYHSAGGYTQLRGYDGNHFSDTHLSIVQYEWRRHLYKRLFIVPFIEGGVMGGNPTTLRHSLFSYGLATHIAVGPTSIRFETAYSKQNSAFYFGFNHAF